MGQPTIIADSFILAAEIASNPPVPDVNSLQVYVKDVAGISHPFTQDHSGTVRDLFIPKGTATNDNAAAGEVGEYIEGDVANASAISLTSGASANVTSISLTAGDWDVYGSVAFKGGTTTGVAFLIGSVSQTTAAIDGTKGRRNDLFYDAANVKPVFQNNNNPQATLAPTRMALASTTSVFLVAQASFAISTCSAYGTIGARRVR